MRTWNWMPEFDGALTWHPPGAKDLLSVPGYPMTWGAMLFKDQVLDTKAAVDCLEAAGAVLIAKFRLALLSGGMCGMGGKPGTHGISSRDPAGQVQVQGRQSQQGSSGLQSDPNSGVHRISFNQKRRD